MLEIYLIVSIGIALIIFGMYVYSSLNNPPSESILIQGNNNSIEFNGIPIFVEYGELFISKECIILGKTKIPMNYLIQRFGQIQRIDLIKGKLLINGKPYNQIKQ